MDLAAGDFVITPNGTWHDHGVESRGQRDYDLGGDGLDMLLIQRGSTPTTPLHVRPACGKSDHPLNIDAEAR